jgi:hypothetical protein
MIEDVYDTMADYAPAFVQQKETTAELPLVSRVSIAGPSIGIDLRERQFLVEGKGHLQVEDYALPDARSREDGASSGATPSLAGLQPLRPSQTLFTWDTSMSYLSRSQTAVFVENVAMTHLAGSEMNALAGVADAMQVEPEWLNALPGREASLECDRFIAEFEASQDKPSDMQASLSSSMRLKQFWAAGQPVRLEEGPRYIVGSQMSFNSQTQVGQLEGGEDQPAQLVIKSPELHVIKVDHFIWNQATGILEAYEPDVEGTGG